MLIPGVAIMYSRGEKGLLLNLPSAGLGEGSVRQRAAMRRLISLRPTRERAGVAFVPMRRSIALESGYVGNYLRRAAAAPLVQRQRVRGVHRGCKTALRLINQDGLMGGGACRAGGT